MREMAVGSPDVSGESEEEGLVVWAAATPMESSIPTIKALYMNQHHLSSRPFCRTPDVEGLLVFFKVDPLQEIIAELTDKISERCAAC